MHTLYIAGSLILALAGCLTCVGLLHLTRLPLTRRVIEVAGLFIPMIALILVSVLLMHFLTDICFLVAPPVDVALTQILTVVGGIGVALALLLNLLRAAVLPIRMKRRTWEAPAQLQIKVAMLARNIGLRRVPLARVCADTRAWALVTGLVEPQLVVSSGLVGLLDEDELEAALCHELQHIRRGDLWWTVICGVFRDFTWFLPTSRYLYSLILSEQEIACDDGVIGEGRRLALASALVRVWQRQLESAPTPRGALALLSPPKPSQIEARVRRLLGSSGTIKQSRPYIAVLGMAGLLLVFATAQVATAIAVMSAMGCSMQFMGQ